MNEIEELQQSGKLPTRYYNQMNGQTAQKNYKRYKIKKKKRNDNFLLDILIKSLQTSVKIALDEIFKDFKF